METPPTTGTTTWTRREWMGTPGDTTQGQQRVQQHGHEGNEGGNEPERERTNDHSSTCSQEETGRGRMQGSFYVSIIFVTPPSHCVRVFS
jgi:hypothetical protein